MRKYTPSPYKTPIKFLVSAVPFIVGLRWLPVAWLYRVGVREFLNETQHLAILGSATIQSWGGFFSRLSTLTSRGLCWLRSAQDTEVVAVVLIWIPLWMPVVSCFVAVVLLVPRMVNLVNTRTMLPLLVCVDPRTYMRIHLAKYGWNLSYFAVYFLLAFPITLLALFGVLHQFWTPTISILRPAPLRLWWLGAESALAASIVVAPYNELLLASVIIPTPLMQLLRFSKLIELLEQFRGAVLLARRANPGAIERLACLCETECRGLHASNIRLLKEAERASPKWASKLSREIRAGFSRLNVYYLSEALQCPASPLCKEQLSTLKDYLIACGASSHPPVVPQKIPITRRIARDFLLVVAGVLVVLVLVSLMVYWS